MLYKFRARQKRGLQKNEERWNFSDISHKKQNLKNEEKL